MNPLLRGLYMLNVSGLNIEESSITMDQSFLGEIMEWNEQVEEIKTKESLENLKQNVDVILVDVYKLVGYFNIFYTMNYCNRYLYVI